MDEYEKERIAVQREAERKIRRDYEYISTFGWDEKEAIIEKYLALLRSNNRHTRRVEAKLDQVKEYFARNPHRKRPLKSSSDT